MIHIATVHWSSDQWVDPQLHYLNRHIDEPFRMYAWLDNRTFLAEDGPNMSESHGQKFHYWTDIKLRAHETKLTLLGDIMANGAADDDILIFIDGDAFPIAPIMPFLREKLEQYPLVAIQRLENNGDSQPHPCFCVTTAKFWRELPGDWRRGGTWINPQGVEVTDVGGNLRQLLIDKDIDWLPILRSNKVNPHPLNFGVYGDLVYHHGGGFRATAGGRVMLSDVEDRFRGTLRVKITGRLPKKGVLGRVRRRVHPIARYRANLIDQLSVINQEVFELILRDEDFYLPLIDPDADGELTKIIAPIEAQMAVGVNAGAAAATSANEEEAEEAE
ncbi:hypothetical protein BH10ACT11_BH10ACT11_03330 [soil metagenome]